MSKSTNVTRFLRTSKTLDSLAELAPKTSTPSTSSSGYGSQAVSSTNLSTEDSASLRSISVDETPDFETRPPLNSDLHPVSEVSDATATDMTESTDNDQDMSDNAAVNRQNNDRVESDSHSDGNSIVKTNLSPGRVVRRRKTSSKNSNRASFPQARPQSSESRVAQHLEQKINQVGLSHNDDGMDSSTDRLEGKCFYEKQIVWKN